MPAPAVKERPILFSGPMVRAILAGRKTQTRRVVKHRDDRWEVDDDGNGGPLWPFWPDYVHGGDLDDPRLPCPYGVPGDRLWVRETWRPYSDDELFDSILYAADGAIEKPNIKDCDVGLRFSDDCDRWGKHGANRSPIHMPRWASRITLEITGVRVERIQEISAKDVVAEGCPFSSDRDYFRELWHEINGKRGFGWDVNPWVWVVEFKRINPEASE